MTVAKVAVSVPAETLRAVEARRRVLGLSRSAVVAAALESWLADEAMTAEERRYVAAYLKQPESVTELREGSALGAAGVAGWEPWDAESPSLPAPEARPRRAPKRAAPARAKAKAPR